MIRKVGANDPRLTIWPLMSCKHVRPALVTMALPPAVICFTSLASIYPVHCPFAVSCCALQA